MVLHQGLGNIICGAVCVVCAPKIEGTYLVPVHTHLLVQVIVVWGFFRRERSFFIGSDYGPECFDALTNDDIPIDKTDSLSTCERFFVKSTVETQVVYRGIDIIAIVHDIS